jgi:ABC-type antimicrobial peptide transport system permease subunit
MAFTVARRTREIGIRVALGADRHRIVTGTLSRVLAQVGLGIVAGTIPGSMVVAWGVPESRREQARPPVLRRSCSLRHS